MFPFLVSLYDSVPSWPTGTHEVEVYGFGKATLTEACAEAAKKAAWFTAQFGRAHRARFFFACPTCKITGVKPGTKTVRCPACDGEGRLELGGDHW